MDMLMMSCFVGAIQYGLYKNYAIIDVLIQNINIGFVSWNMSA